MRKCVRRPYSGPGTQSSVSWLAAQSPFYQPWCPHCTGSHGSTYDERRNSWVHSGHLQGQRALLPHEEEQGAFLSLQPWMGWWPARTFTVKSQSHVRPCQTGLFQHMIKLELSRVNFEKPNLYQMWAPLFQFVHLQKEVNDPHRVTVKTKWDHTRGTLALHTVDTLTFLWFWNSTPSTKGHLSATWRF